MEARLVLGTLLVFVSLLSPSVASFTVWNQTDFTNCAILTLSVGSTDYDYRMYWSLNDTTIDIGLAAKVNGWMGIGISTNGEMDSGGGGSDLWVGWVGVAFSSCTEACVADYWATEHYQPVPDGNNNLRLSDYGSTDGYKYLRFTRPLDTGDTEKDRPITPDQTQWLIHALGDTLPSSFTDFGRNGVSGQHISGTNQASRIRFGDEQWSCDAVPQVNDSSTGFYENPQQTWRLNWTINADQTINFTMSAQTSSWWALGINTIESMVGADIIWCSFDGSTPELVDRKASSRSTPPADSRQDVTLISAETDGGWSTCRFRRALDTGDSAGDLPILNGNMKLLWAFDKSSRKRTFDKRDCPDFCQHTSSSKGLATVNFLSGSTAEVNLKDDKRKAHGILMLFAWGLLAVAGTFISRYCKTPQGKWVLYGYVWVHLHGFIGVSIFVINLIAFALIVSWVSDQQIDHFKGAHEVIGLIMFICAFFQPLVGIIAELFLKKYKDPNWVAYIIGSAHAWFGLALVLLGLVEVYLGLALYCVPTYTMVTYGVSIACMIALFGVHEVLRWVAPWGSWLGGPGFTYKRVEDDDSGTEMKELESEGKLPWMNMRPARQPPLLVKVSLWILQAGIALVIIGLWIATAVGIGDKNINDPNDSYDSQCAIGTKFQ